MPSFVFKPHIARCDCTQRNEDDEEEEEEEAE